MAHAKVLWHFFPKSRPCPAAVQEVISLFQARLEDIDSFTHVGLHSNGVLEILRPSLQKIGFTVETGRSKAKKIQIPVLFGENGKIIKYFEADAYNAEIQTVLEVEAGRAVSNYQFLKDLFQACVMQNVEYAIIAVRQEYRGANDYEKVIAFMDTLYSSDRLNLPLKGLMIIGY